MSTMWTTTVMVLTSPVDGLSGLLRGAGAWSGGWAIVVLAAGWWLLSSPLALRRARRNALSERLRAQHSAGKDMRSAETRRSVQRAVQDDLAVAGAGRRPAESVAVIGQVLVVLVVALWSRFSEHAVTARFAGVPRLDALAGASGPGGWAWAGTLGLTFLAVALLTHRAARQVAGHQRVIGLVLTPAFFVGLGLALPMGVVVAFVTVMLCSLLPAAATALRPPAAVPSRSVTEVSRAV